MPCQDPAGKLPETQQHSHRVSRTAEVALTRSPCTAGRCLNSCGRTPPIGGLLAPGPVRRSGQLPVATILTLAPVLACEPLRALHPRGWRPSREGASCASNRVAVRLGKVFFLTCEQLLCSKLRLDRFPRDQALHVRNTLSLETNLLHRRPGCWVKFTTTW